MQQYVRVVADAFILSNLEISFCQHTTTHTQTFLDSVNHTFPHSCFAGLLNCNKQ